MNHLALNLDPPKVLLVDPKLTRDLGKHPAVLTLGMVAGMRRRLQHIGRPAVDRFFADHLEVEGQGHFPYNRRGLFLLLAQSLGPLFWIFPLHFFERVFLCPFLPSRERVPVVFHKLVERNPIDQNRSRYIHILRFHAPCRIPVPVFVTLDIGVMEPHLPVTLGGRDR